jgi:mycoredoxin
MTEDEIVIYGTSWCYQSKRAKALLEKSNIPFRWVDIEKDEQGRAFVEKTNRGYRSVPTIVFPDGSILVEPSETELNQKIKPS